MIAHADQDIDLLLHGDFCGVAATAGGAKVVEVHDDDGTSALCELADECFGWARADNLLAIVPSLYFRCWRLLAKARLLALHHRAARASRVAVEVSIAREGDRMVACFHVLDAQG